MSDPFQRDPLRAIRINGCLVLLLLLFGACLVPLLFVNLMTEALQNLHLTRAGALLVIGALLFGSFINIPIARIPREEEVVVPMLEPVGGWQLFPRLVRQRAETIVAVNVGGCIVPLLLSIRMLRFAVDAGPSAWSVLLLGVAANTLICYRFARVIPNLGIVLPTFIAPLIALAAAYLGLGDASWDAVRAPVAFVIGVCGPLLGADLLHWKDFHKLATGMISIGGAGTWDGIVLSGLVAAFFA